jgi:hypothetical protein
MAQKENLLTRLEDFIERMKFLSHKQMGFASNRLYEIGTDLGGWIKQQKPVGSFQ